MPFFVLFGFRFLYLIYQRPGGAQPDEAFLTDGPFLINLLLWRRVVIYIVYVG